MSERAEHIAPAIVARPPVPLPDWPEGWYAVARASDLPPGAIRSVTLAGREIVLFRTQARALGAVDAHCPHMGTHLARGRVRGEHLECPLHCWRIANDGAVVDRRERARSWTLRERFGLVLLELGSGHPLPDAGGEDFSWTQAAPLDIATGWHSLLANAFDMPHLTTVHRRELIAAPEVSFEPGRRFSLHYVSRVRGRAASDRAMKWLSQDRIDVRMHCEGPIMLVDTDLQFTRTAACIGMTPTEHGTRVHAAFGVRAGRFQTLRLALARWLFAAFLRRDIGILERMRLRTDVDDPILARLFDFLRTLRPMLG